VAALVGVLVSASATLTRVVFSRSRTTGHELVRGPAAFRLATMSAGALAIGLGVAAEGADGSYLVGWALTLAASTVFPLIVLGIWFRGLTRAGALVGMAAGFVTTLGSAVSAQAIAAGLLSVPGTLAGLAEQPAVLTVPLAFVLMLVVSRATPSMVPMNADDRILRMHAPEQLGLGPGGPRD
jgi:Na+(H+)/acetate symporter ActP